LSNFYYSSALGASIWNFFFEGKFGLKKMAGPASGFVFYPLYATAYSLVNPVGY
jgi:hypothetical protein